MSRPWTTAEEALLHEHYRSLGLKGVAKLLPGRSRSAIAVRAHHLCLTRPLGQSRTPLRDESTLADADGRLLLEVGCSRLLRAIGVPSRRLAVRTGYSKRAIDAWKRADPRSVRFLIDALQAAGFDLVLRRREP